MSKYRELLLGCGHSRDKRVFIPSREYERDPIWKNLTTLDIDPACEPDIVFDLCSLEWNPFSYLVIDYGTQESMRIRMDDNTFDEIHAYEVLEHCGEQGDHKLLFAQFREFWRVLKPGGYFCATVPDYRSVWAWGDPSHTRIINAGTLVFLSKKQYAKQVGKTAMSDFRALMDDMDFEIVNLVSKAEQMEFVLMAVK